MNIVLLIALLAARDSVGCPATVQVKEQLAAPVAGWTAASDGMPHQLAGLTFFDGRPEEKASLAPDSQNQTAAVWKFAGGGPTWVMCRYSGTGITLTRELPRGTSTCTASYSKGVTIAGLPVIQKIACR